MSNLYSQETLGLSPGFGFAIVKPFTAAYGGRVRRYRAVLNLGATTSTVASIGSGASGTPPVVRPTVAVNVGDNVLLAVMPAGAILSHCTINSTVSLGSSVIAIGTNQVHANNGQYVAAQTFTTPNAPTLAGTTTAEAADPIIVPTGQSVYLTVGTAALPTAGTLIIELFFSQP